jgi:hypothetical protein
VNRHTQLQWADIFAALALMGLLSGAYAFVSATHKPLSQQEAAPAIAKPAVRASF